MFSEYPYSHVKGLSKIIISCIYRYSPTGLIYSDGKTGNAIHSTKLWNLTYNGDPHAFIRQAAEKYDPMHNLVSKVIPQIYNTFNHNL